MSNTSLLPFVSFVSSWWIFRSLLPMRHSRAKLRSERRWASHPALGSEYCRHHCGWPGRPAQGRSAAGTNCPSINPFPRLT